MGSILMTVLLQVSLAGEAQTVSISGKELPLKEIFSIVKNQTGLLFFYDATILLDAKPVTIKLKNASLEMALNEVFKDQPLTWVLEDKTVTIIRKPLKFTALSTTPPSQSPLSISIKGVITDLNGNPISDVSVLIKGTKRGTVSDKTGGFSIEAKPKNILILSSVNYSSKEVKVEKGKMNIKLELDVKPMESFLVGGNFSAMKRKTDATTVTVIDSKKLERIPNNTLDQIFRGWAPGTNSFDVGDETESFPTLSIRGAASSTSLSTIAVYIDGIEYAGGSGYLSQLDKNNIDRVEIVKGPGAATMYGTGSNAGIVQIFTKKGPANQNSVNLTSSAGYYKSKWVESNPFQQMHNLETITSFKNVTLRLGGSFRSVDAYLPDGGEKNKGFYASARFNKDKWELNVSSRYNDRNYSLSRRPYYDTAVNPRQDILLEPVPGLIIPAYIWMNVMPSSSRYKNGITQTYVNGLNLSHKTKNNWTNHFDAGFTVNDSREVPAPVAGAPLQRQYFTVKNNITTIRYSNVLNLDNSNGLETIISSGVEYKKYSASTTITRATAAATLFIKDPDNENYGAFVQLNPSYKNIFLTMGLRYEKNNLFKAAWNHRVGLTTNFKTGLLTIKPRISWGKGITSPQYEQRFGTPANISTIVYANPDIKPQSQQGFDYGVELYDRKGKFKLEVVYYDNILKDMIAQEELGAYPKDTTVVAFIYRNVGKVANKGWEFSGEYKVGRFSLGANFSIMSSTIKDTTGAFRIYQFKNKAPGTEMMNLPRHTAGLELQYSFYKLFGKSDKGVISLSVTEVDGIKTTDYRSYAIDVAYGRTPYDPGGLSYPVITAPVFRVGLYADYCLLPNLRLFTQGYNILNDYDYEYSSDYPTHGATWLFGLKYSFSKANN
ncbi:TonB-dependent receptor domain-containing protein [Flavitalea sp.]|nr:TonB-dependent receptor [Flavitalea sp.]